MENERMNEEEAKKIIDALVEYWYDKVLNKMAVAPFPNFDEALEEVKQEMIEE